jgi:hypothetical protein
LICQRNKKNPPEDCLGGPFFLRNRACISGDRLFTLGALLFMKINGVALALVCLIAHQVWAGDAVAMGYNYEGVWTAVTYNRSSTPKGGAHYREAAQAGAAAVRDLRVRASEDLAWTKIISKSDRTGYVAVARGTEKNANKVVTAIGRGQSQSEADEKALKTLNGYNATIDQTIVYRYFSYGSDSTVHHRAAHHTKGGHTVASKS